MWISVQSVLTIHYYDFPGGSVGKESTCNAGGSGSIPGSGRPLGEENGNHIQHSCLGNLMDRGDRQTTVYKITCNQTRLGNETTTAIHSVCTCSVVSSSCNLMDCSWPGSSVHGIFTRQEYSSRLPFPSPGDLLDPGIFLTHGPFTVAMIYKVAANTEVVNTECMAPRGKYWVRFLCASGCNIVNKSVYSLVLYLFLRPPYLVYTIDSLTLNSWPTAP